MPYAAMFIKKFPICLKMIPTQVWAMSPIYIQSLAPSEEALSNHKYGKRCFISGWLVCSMLAKRFRCDSDTPLDRPVVPLEYGMNATSLFDLLFFRIEVSTIGSSISLKSHAPSGLEPLPLTDIMYSGFTPGPFISCWASKTLGNNSGIVTTPCAPEPASTAPSEATANSGMLGNNTANTWPGVAPLFFKLAANLLQASRVS
ncbi:hypothetical protein AGLY_001079, partial [Aphis glycines]